MLIRLGYNLAPLHEGMVRFFTLLLLATPIGLVLAGLAGYSIVRRALLPLDLKAVLMLQLAPSRLLIVSRLDELLCSVAILPN